MKCAISTSMSAWIQVTITGVLLLGCSSATHQPTYNGSEIKALPGQAVIVIYRDKAFKGAALNWTLSNGTKELAVISIGTYYPYLVEPGLVQLYAAPCLKFSGYKIPTGPADVGLSVLGETYRSHRNENPTVKLAHSMEVESEKTYYLRWTSKFGSGYPVVTEVDPQHGREALFDKRLAQGPDRK